MKALTDCSGVYRTPWCDMLFGDGCCGINRNVLHLWYKIEWLQKEIEKRSSYLGKFRKTEEAKHLLDLIAMTKDEEDLFYPFAKAAASDVTDALHRYMPKEQKTFLWREGRHTKVITDLPAVNITNPNRPNVSLSGNTIRVSTGLQTDNIDPQTMGIYNLIEVEYQVGYIIKQTGQRIIETRSIEKMAELSYDSTYNTWSYLDVWGVDLQDESDETSAEFLTGTTVFKSKEYLVYWLNPTQFQEGDYVEWNGQLYRAIKHGNANYPSECLVLTDDYRDSIHYLIGFPKDKYLNIVEALDTAVFEALVARIIFKWLEYAYPDEAERYLTAYNEELEKIKKRCALIIGGQIVNRIPRLL